VSDSLNRLMSRLIYGHNVYRHQITFESILFSIHKVQCGVIQSMYAQISVVRVRPTYGLRALGYVYIGGDCRRRTFCVRYSER
jgi:hypothetical protein